MVSGMTATHPARNPPARGSPSAIDAAVDVVNGGNKAEYRPVEIGPLAGNLRIIRSGLKPGDRVVVGGLQKVRPGDTVAPVKVKTDLADLTQLEAGGQRLGRSTGQN